MTTYLALGLFTVFVLALLALDLGAFQRRPHALRFREAILASVLWITLALLFNLGIYFWRGQQPALEFLTGYILELSLSLDNVFIFALTFTYAAVPAEDQHRVLFWGIVGALVMRASFIVAGVELILHFHWVLYMFGAFLVFSGFMLLFRKKEEVHPERNPVLRLARRMFPVTEKYEGAHFFVRRNGHRLATPLFLVLLMIETTDVLMAVDSIPAVLGVTEDPFIVYTSNIFAVLGLRALYFVLARALLKFRYLHVGLALVLVFVGATMLGAHFYKTPVHISLAVICSVVFITVMISVLRGGTRQAADSIPPKQK